MRDRKYVTRLLALIVSTCEPFDPRSIKPTIKPTLQRIEPGSRSRKGLGNGPERAWVTVPKGPGSRGNRVTWPWHEFQKGLGHGPERALVRVPKGPGSRGLGMSSKRAWVTVPKGPGSGSRKGLSHGPKRARLLTYFGFYTRKS